MSGRRSPTRPSCPRCSEQRVKRPSARRFGPSDIPIGLDMGAPEGQLRPAGGHEPRNGRREWGIPSAGGWRRARVRGSPTCHPPLTASDGAELSNPIGNPSPTGCQSRSRGRPAHPSAGADRARFAPWRRSSVSVAEARRSLCVAASPRPSDGKGALKVDPRPLPSACEWIEYGQGRGAAWRRRRASPPGAEAARRVRAGRAERLGM